MLAKFQGDLVAAIFAVIIVCILLVLLTLIIKLQKKVFSIEEKVSGVAHDIKLLPQREESEKNIHASKDEGDEELVAVIMASICAYTGMTMDQFEVKSIKMVNNSSNWRKQNLFS